MTHDLDTRTADYEPPTESHDRGNGRSSSGARQDGSRLAPSRRRWPWLAAGLVVGGGASFVAAGWGDGADDAEPLVAETVELATVQVTTQDLVEEVEWAGTLSAGLTLGIPSPTDGVVTAAPASGDTIERGDVVVEIDSEPVVALFGEIPMWRDLSEGVEGGDVRQLEANLVRLGYDPDGEVTVDNMYTSATEHMVERWEEALDIETTGVVGVERVVVVPGPTVVVEAPTVGASAQAGADLVSVDAAVTGIDVIGWETEAESGGEIDVVAEVGTPIEHGTVLYTADGVDAVSVVETDPGSDAVLDAMESGDIELLESVLVYLGFDPDGLIEIDDDLDLLTNAAVIRWQESVGLPATGSTDASDYVLIEAAADAPYAVGDVYLAVGDRLGNGAIVLTLETPTLAVTADVAVEEIDEFAVGDVVVVEQLDESTFDAVVVSIAEVANEAEAQGESPTITVTFDVVSEPENYVSGAVTVVSESSRIDDAMVVPSRALVALREGGFAVERRLDDGATELVGVEIGTFDDSMVEIVSVTVGDLRVGDDLVVPT